MPLEEPHSIDIIVPGDDGALELIITDAGLSPDDATRMARFLEKLRNYMGYVLSPEFAEKYPGQAREKVCIKLVSNVPPTADMAAIKQIRSRTDPPLLLSVAFEQFG